MSDPLVQNDIKMREAQDGKIRFGEKFAYAMGDVACNVVFALTTTLLTYFYTNVVGVSIALVGMIMLVSRVFDGVSDVVFGLLVDKTNGKHGKARSWVLWMILPYGLSAVSLFLIPAGATELVQGIYIFVTYNLVTTIVYTLLQIGYNTLLALMTRDQGERSKISILRMGLAAIMNLIVASLTLPFVRVLGNDQRAWIIVTSIYSLVAMGLLLCTFKFTKERVVVTSESNKKIPVLKSLKALFQNKYWLMVLGMWTLFSVSQTVVGVDQVYYCQYIYGNPELTGLLTLAQVLPLLLILLTVLGPLVKKFGNRNVSLVGILIAIVGQLILIINPTNFTNAVVASVVRGIGQAPLTGVFFAMISDTIEYGQWRTHVRIEGLTNSAVSVGAKVGGGLTNAAVGGLLAAAGFSGLLATQPAAATATISGLYLYAPLAVWILIACLLFFYKLDAQYPQIMKDLHEREAKGEL